MNNQKTKKVIIVNLAVLVIATGFLIFWHAQKNNENTSTSQNKNLPKQSNSIPEIGGVYTDDWSLTINGIAKENKFEDVYASYDTPIKMVIEDPETGTVIYEVEDLTNKQTNLDTVLPKGTEYMLRFYDANGTLMEPAWPNIKVTK